MPPTARRFLLGLVLVAVPGQTQDTRRVDNDGQPAKAQEFLFEVQPREIAAGETAVLRWSIKGATKVLIEEAPEAGTGRGELRKLGTFEGSSGTLEVRPKENTKYVVTCQGSTTYSCASVTVRIRVKRP